MVLFKPNMTAFFIKETVVLVLEAENKNENKNGGDQCNGGVFLLKCMSVVKLQFDFKKISHGWISKERKTNVFVVFWIANTQ